MPTRRSMAAGAVLLASLFVCSSAAHSRIVEKEIAFPNLQSVQQEGSDVPIVDPPKRIAGYFKLNRTEDAHMFYFAFQSRHDSAEDPVVLWMTGGPGCSSEIAVFFENGPYSINDDMTLSETMYGWDAAHTVIFVDQPINTGFSYSNDERDRVFDEEQVADDMLDFLQEFFEVHPDLSERPFFITGESYAGHYIPVVSHRVWAAAKAGEGKPINLQGLAIGNGLTNPSIQFPAYADFALQNNLINQVLHDAIVFWSPICSFMADVCEATQWWWLCGFGLGTCMSSTFGPILAANPGINVYDIKKKCDGPLCYDFSNADQFLNMASTQTALGVSKPWESCDWGVHADFNSDWLRDYTHLIPDMLEDGLRVMIYAGDLDLICNWLGNSRWVDAMEWSGQTQFQEAEETEWSAGGASAGGTVKSAAGLSFVKVYEAGHMVPMDQPQNALGMISAFTRGKELSGMSPSGSSLEDLLAAVDAQPRAAHTTATPRHEAYGGAGAGAWWRMGGHHPHRISMPRGMGPHHQP